MKNIFVSTTFLKDSSKLSEALSQCSKANIYNVEIGSNHCYENNYNYIYNSNFTYLVHNYFPVPKKAFYINIASLDESIRAKSIEQIKKSINLCNEINALLYTFHPGFITDPGNKNNMDSYDFNWINNNLKFSNKDKSKDLMYKSLDEIIKYSKIKKVPLALETEGSVVHKKHLHMQEPEEYSEFVSKYNKEDIGISLNIGHLNLASKVFKFDRDEFVELIKNNIISIELSHNNRVDDQHLPLKKNSWYWDIINRDIFHSTYKILEYRNVSINTIQNNINEYFN